MDTANLLEYLTRAAIGDKAIVIEFRRDIPSGELRTLMESIRGIPLARLSAPPGSGDPFTHIFKDRGRLALVWIPEGR